jgi:hypothetical protein
MFKAINNTRINTMKKQLPEYFKQLHADIYFFQSLLI